MHKSERITKLYIFAISTLLTAFTVFLFFLDKSLEWEAIKIISCIIVGVWIFFIIPSFRYVYLKYKNMTRDQFVNISVHIAIYGFILPIIIAPVWGVLYFFTKYKSDN